ncbi:MAG TPA: cyclic pyranopterin monophosphate synthase MoaC [Gemmatimonadaceae bacterium]|nr:cyclic pyranopterin monophosphate synthase MoaC [Gemmatimonadaceae bacterium]
MTTGELNHIDAAGLARMVDVSGKPDTDRVAVASGTIRMQPATLDLIRRQALPKGDLLTVARIAGIQGAKRTSDLIPLCHPLPLRGVEVALEVDVELPGIRAQARVRTIGPTGVEMEAMAAVSIALLTVYDMAKAVDREMILGDIRVESKDGGRSGSWRRSPPGDEATP